MLGAEVREGGRVSENLQARRDGSRMLVSSVPTVKDLGARAGTHGCLGGSQAFEDGVRDRKHGLPHWKTRFPSREDGPPSGQPAKELTLSKAIPSLSK